MFERALNIFWILLGGAAAAYAWTLGLVGPSGPDSGLFPFISALIVMGAGVVLLLRSPGEAVAPEFPRGAALGRVLGVAAGLAFMLSSRGDHAVASGPAPDRCRPGVPLLRLRIVWSRPAENRVGRQ